MNEDSEMRNLTSKSVFQKNSCNGQNNATKEAFGMHLLTSVLASCFIATTIVACGDSQLDEQTGPQDTQEQTQKTARGSQDSSTPAESNPLSLVKMIEFSGPEVEGFHNCFWVGPVSYETYNIAYPDEGAVYWGSNFQLPENASHLEIRGNYPNARYMSYNAYDKLSQPTDAILDADIVASTGANPFASDDKSGGSYIVNVVAGPAPSGERPGNTLYLGDPETRNTQLPLLLRIYVPAAGTDYTGGAGMPEVALVMNDGERLTGDAMCKAVNSPFPGSPDRKSPSVAMEESTYKNLVYGPGAPEGFPAKAEVEWLKFWGGAYSVSRHIPDRKFLETGIAGSAAGRLAKKAGFYSNTHNDYISTYVNEAFGEMVVLKGKMPRTPASGWDIASGEYDLRYWSLCSNESIVTTAYSDCIYDSNVVLDEDRNFTIVVSRAVNRPINAKAECGITWLDWGERGNGVGDASQSYLILRNMSGDDFQQSIQNVSSMASAEKDMGPYYPVTSYSSKADFEALGCLAAE
jgi:hypothetical protein